MAGGMWRIVFVLVFVAVRRGRVLHWAARLWEVMTSRLPLGALFRACLSGKRAGDDPLFKTHVLAEVK